jgi:DNA-binding FrmR family transcriptional regulator
MLAMPKTETPTRGYASTRDQHRARLKRIETQIRGIERMVEDDRYCIDILTQISAAQAAFDKVALGLLDGHAHTCVIGAEPDRQDADQLEEHLQVIRAVGLGVQ